MKTQYVEHVNGVMIEAEMFVNIVVSEKQNCKELGIFENEKLLLSVCELSRGKKS